MSTRARATTIQTAHGPIETPVFMPVGTHATVRGQWHRDLDDIGFPCLLANTYHLLLRPGPDTMAKMGGLHRFMGWDRAILTDSGGFQIFSLPNEREMSEEGAVFRSYLDGQKILLSPEKSIAMQRCLGSDIMMALDQCIPATADLATTRAAMELTHRWAERSLAAARGGEGGKLFAIVQGACHPELRRASAETLTALDCDGFAIGGLAVGETKAEREAMTEIVTELLPKEKPRYLMGVGTPLDLLEAVHRGVDMFDCILPTALARKGVAFTSRGRIELRRGVHELAERALDPKCACPTCARYSRAYLHHLIDVEESFGWQAIALHNLHFYGALARDMRRHILDGAFEGFHREWREILGAADLDNPITPPKRTRRRGPAPTLGDYAIHQGPGGHFSIRHAPSGEVMHSVNDPAEEARRLYLEQSRLAALLAEPGEPIVIWDVGLGAAINAMAVVKACEEMPLARDLEIVSFENDLDSLRLTLRHPHRFAHVRHPAPATLLDRREWRNGRIGWRLYEGDFLETLAAAPPPSIVFYDPFSFKTDGALWTPAAFRRLFAKLEPVSARLFTYSASTAVRAGLLAAGFLVGKGVGTGPKSETTIALTPRAAGRGETDARLLGGDWLARWERSGARIPPSVGESDRARFESAVRGHSQFVQ